MPVKLRTIMDTKKIKKFTIQLFSGPKIVVVIVMLYRTVHINESNILWNIDNSFE